MTRTGAATGMTAGPWARIDTSAIAWNLAWLRRRLRERSSGARHAPPRLWAVVKADAYGHGLEHALAALAEADGLAIACADDILQLRDAGWHRPIVLLSCATLDFGLLDDPRMGELHLVIDEPASLARLERTAMPGKEIHAWLRHAGDLRSMGFEGKEYTAAFARLHALAMQGRLAGAGHLHHYACAEDPVSLALEREAFDALTAGLPGPRCSGNSASLCSDAPQTYSAKDEWLRCGLALYGASALPGRSGPELGLRPAMSLQAPLLAIRPVKAGQTVGYGEDYRASCDTRIGVVGMGYGHGLPRHLWRKGHLLAGPDGRRVPFAGRVAMDHLTIDLGPHPAERPGDIMTLWGPTGGGATLPVETVAEACDTIAAALFTGLTARVDRLPVHAPTRQAEAQADDDSAPATPGTRYGR